MNAAAATGAGWDLDQIQGLLLRGYRSNFARHYALSIAAGEPAAAAAKAFLGKLTTATGDALAITTAKPWKVKPAVRLNLAFTYRGLQRCDVPAASLAIFDSNSGSSDSNYVPFGQGAKARAASGLNAPNSADWELSDADFDVMISIWVDTSAALDAIDAELRALVPSAFEPFDSRVFDAQAFEGNKVYFGYEDNISQPAIAGSPFPQPYPDTQDAADPSAFLIGQGANIYSATPFSPPELGTYGCFSGFLVLRQHVEKFEAQVAALAPKMTAFGVTDLGTQKEAVMAAMCGRWRIGTPLSEFPINGNAMPGTFNKAAANNYNYVLADGTPDMGSVCPVGAHMRRGNMRLKASDAPLPKPFLRSNSDSSRIMRRAMPYQYPYMAEDRNDPTTDRGLTGHFLGASLLGQFEQVFGQWMNASFFIDGGLSDPLIGIPDPGTLTIRNRPKPGKMIRPPGQNGLESCVSIRAAAYLFFPGIDGIRFITGTVPKRRGLMRGRRAR